LIREPENEPLPDQSIEQATVLDFGQPTLLVLPLAGDDNGELAQALRLELSKFFNVANETATVLTATLEPAEAARKLRTDVTLDGERVTVGRYTGVRIYLFARGVRQQIWAESFPTHNQHKRLQGLAERSAIALHHALGLPVSVETNQQHYPLAPVQDEYLQGRALLDQAASELNIRRAQASFNAALRQDANFAQAHAGLCETLLLEHWMNDETRALNDAALTCGQALQLKPDDPEVGVAYAHFLRLTGQLQESVGRYQQLLVVQPDHAEALYGLAETHLLAYRQNGDQPSLQQAMSAARAAADADPQYWKPLYLLAPMYYYAGDVNQAIEVSEEALQRDVNEYVVANLGTFQFCAGQHEQARDSYLLAREIAPQSYVGNEFLGKVYYFLGEFETSAELRRKAIESVASGTPEIHEMWGNLADSYFQASQLEEAGQAYLQAAEIVERDFLRGTATASGRASRAYYYIMIEKIMPGRVPDLVKQSIRSELVAVAESVEESNALLRVAQAWMQMDEPARARLALDQVTTRCIGYAAMPDLASLNPQASSDLKY
jgi:tetratricopeptide (TPR) repeat protein